MASETLSCLICHGRVPGVQILSHISEHITYFPHKCFNCDFKCTEPHELYKHQVNTNHKIGENVGVLRFYPINI